MVNKNWALMAVFSFLVASIVTTMAAQTESAPGNASQFRTPLRYDYYEEKCGNVDNIVRRMMLRIVQLQHNAPAKLLRLLFHDCFIRVRLLSIFWILWLSIFNFLFCHFLLFYWFLICASFMSSFYWVLWNCKLFISFSHQSWTNIYLFMNLVCAHLCIIVSFENVSLITSRKGFSTFNNEAEKGD